MRAIARQYQRRGRREGAFKLLGDIAVDDAGIRFRVQRRGRLVNERHVGNFRQFDVEGIAGVKEPSAALRRRFRCGRMLRRHFRDARCVGGVRHIGLLTT